MRSCGKKITSRSGKRRACGGGQTGDVLESEEDRTHLPPRGTAVAEIGE